MNKQVQFLQACETGDLATVKRLINDPNVDPSDYNNYAIRLASENGHFEVVKLLLQDKRVDTSDRDNLAIRLASQNGHLEIAKLLLNHPKVGFKNMNSPVVKQLERDCDKWGFNFEPIEKVMLEIVEERKKEKTKAEVIQEPQEV